MVAILGATPPKNVVINELTTVAAAYSMAQFYRTGEILGDPFALQVAAGMNDNLVDVSTGASSIVLLRSPNADETNSLRSTRALANLLAACASDPAVALSFRELTGRPGLPIPTTTPQAMANLARAPGANLSQIYDLTRIQSAYTPSLDLMPDAWTITVKVNDSGDDQHLIGGLANIVFDARGNAWINNNVIQGTPHSSSYMVVLQSTGKPANGSTGTARSPISGGGLLGAGFGITMDPRGSVGVGNFGWGLDTTCTCYPSPTSANRCSGSLTQFARSGAPISGPSGYWGGAYRVQGVESDGQGNIWAASYGNDTVYVYLKGNPNKVASFTPYEGSQPFD